MKLDQLLEEKREEILREVGLVSDSLPSNLYEGSGRKPFPRPMCEAPFRRKM
jgi:hypothetical protein